MTVYITGTVCFIQVVDMTVCRWKSGGAMVLGTLQCRGVLRIWIRVGQGPTVLAVGAGGDCLDFFYRLSFHFFFSLSLETTRYRLKYCLKEPLSQNKQLTDQHDSIYHSNILGTGFI